MTGDELFGIMNLLMVGPPEVAHWTFQDERTVRRQLQDERGIPEEVAVFLTAARDLARKRSRGMVEGDRRAVVEDDHGV